MAQIKRFHRPDCSGGSCGCWWRLDFRPQGMAGPRKRVEFPTKRAAEKHLAEVAHKVTRHEYRPPASVPTFREAAAEWLTEKADRHPATLAGWRTVLAHLKPLDPLRLDTITVATIERLRDDLRKTLAPHTVRTILGVCTAVFKSAMRKGFAHANPAQLAVRPRNQRKPADEGTGPELPLRPDEVLSSEEIARLLAHATPGLWRTYLATAAATGMRSEELNALQWGDIEFATGRLLVKRSLHWTRDSGQTGTVLPRIGPTKSKAGERTLPLAPELVSILRAWKIQCPPSKSDLVFCRDNGEPLRRSVILRSGVYPACARAKLRRCNVKTLRHSYASGLLARGCAITTVAGLMGHSSPAVTLKTYSHWIASEDHGEAYAYVSGFLGNTNQRIVAQMEATGTLRKVAEGAS